MAKIVVALGGNALGNSPAAQLELVKNTAKSLVALIEKGNEVVISHGNGPQVGSINLGLNYAAEHEQGPPFPFPECGAMSQAYIGYQLQQSLQNELHQLGIHKPVVTLVTQTLVNKDDEAFSHPTKPIGMFYDKALAETIAKERQYSFVEDSGRGYRRVVPSPEPIEIVELQSIAALIGQGNLVISSGGGGIPVVKDQDGTLHGVDAVIDKDKSSALLGAKLQSDQLIILTTVDYIYLNYGKAKQEALKHVTVAEMEHHIHEGHFAQGSMLPKVEASLAFIKNNPKGEVIVTSLERLDDALNGQVGTVIKK